MHAFHSCQFLFFTKVQEKTGMKNRQRISLANGPTVISKGSAEMEPTDS